MKKICCICGAFCSLVFNCCTTNAFVNATSIDASGVEWWNFKEIVTLVDTEFNKAVAKCNDNDIGCYLDERDNFFDMKPRGAFSIANINFIITTINPSEKKLKVFFRDKTPDSRIFGEDAVKMSHLWIAGIHNNNFLKEVVTVDFDYESTMKDVFYDVAEIEPNTEIEISFDMIDAEPMRDTFTGDLKGVFYWAMTTKNMGISYGVIDYSSCINSSDYSDGNECVASFSENGDYRFLPKKMIENSDESIIKNDIEDVETKKNDEIFQAAYDEELNNEETPQDNTEMEGEILTDVEDDVVGEALKNVEDNVVGEVASSKVADRKLNETLGENFEEFSDEDFDEIELPLAGKTMLAKQERIKTFPWWLTIFVMAGWVVFLWFFGPKKRKK